MKRVYCLYRVSTAQQVDVVKDDIPMQRIACHDFAARMGWTILVEKEEKGISGFKVSAEKRDAIQELKEAALNKEFDVLLVFMFDRLGRIENETPFVLEWFADHGIEVWSVNEGQQKFDQHVDKLMNYIRFWQASGESEKTSIRVKTRMHQMVAEGIYTGGSLPYGYMLVDKGRKNKKGQVMRDLAICPEEAEIVKALAGESDFSGEDLATALRMLREKLDAETKELVKLKAEEADEKRTNDMIIPAYRQFKTWSVEFEESSFEAKKMIAGRLFRRIEVRKDYEITYEMNLTYAKFCEEWLRIHQTITATE